MILFKLHQTNRANSKKEDHNLPQDWNRTQATRPELLLF